jgi:hypothetical protein
LPICASLPRPARPAREPRTFEQALRQREIRRADLYRQFEQAAFSRSPIPVVAPNELDLPEDN